MCGLRIFSKLNIYSLFNISANQVISNYLTELNHLTSETKSELKKKYYLSSHETDTKIESLSLTYCLLLSIFYMIRKLNSSKRIALIAHDHKKIELIEWSVKNKESLVQHQLYATGTTGRLLQEALNVPVTKLLSGPLGGDQQIGAMIAEEKIDSIIFFWDPMEALPHDPDIKALLRLAAVWNIPMACNRSTADFLLSSPLMHIEYDIQMTDYSAYLTRKV